jgi:hypothetical protein
MEPKSRSASGLSRAYTWMAGRESPAVSRAQNVHGPQLASKYIRGPGGAVTA